MSSSAIQVAKTATYLPDLVEVQRASFKWFLDLGLIEELDQAGDYKQAYIHYSDVFDDAQ